MYPYGNEEVAWQRLQDLQREMEYSRQLADRGLPALARLAQLIGGRIRAMVKAGRPARRADRAYEEADSASDAA